MAGPKFLTNDQVEVLAFVALFTDSPGPLSEDPAPGIDDIGEWMLAVEKRLQQWVATAPRHWFDVMIDLVENPVEVEGATSSDANIWINDQDREDRAFNIAILLGLWGQREPDRFFSTICPRLMSSPARETLISAVGDTFLPRGLACLEEPVRRLAELNEAEAIALIGAIGTIDWNNERGIGAPWMERIRAALSLDFAEAWHEIAVFERNQGMENPNNPGLPTEK